MKIIHIHQPKTAGTSLRESLHSAYPMLKICPARYPEALRAQLDGEFDVYSGHFSMDDTKTIDGKYITIFRDPIDRFMSVYYFWRQLYSSGVEISRSTKLAAKYDLAEFAKIQDEPSLIQEFFNRITWQIAHSIELAKRSEFRISTGMTEQQILGVAIASLDKFSVIGLQEGYPAFLNSLNAKLGLSIPNKLMNVTSERAPAEQVPSNIRKLIERWVYLDLELFEKAKTHPNTTRA